MLVTQHATRYRIGIPETAFGLEDAIITTNRYVHDHVVDEMTDQFTNDDGDLTAMSEQDTKVGSF